MAVAPTAYPPPAPRPPAARRSRRLAVAVAGLLLLGLVLRLGLIALTPDYRPRLDDSHYDGLACAILLTGSYPLRVPSDRTETSCGRAARGSNPSTAFRPPGWPAALAGAYAVNRLVTDHRWTAARVAQALIGLLGAALIGLVGWQLLGPAGGLAALGLAALDSTLIAVGGALLSEPLFVCLVVGSLAAALAARASPRALAWAALAGALVGAATLVRSNGLALLPVVAVLAAPAPWRRRPALARAGAVAAAAVLAVAPWTVRNAIAMDAFVPVASYFGTGLADTFNESSRTRTDFPGAWRSPRLVAAFQDIHHSDMTELERQAELRRRALAYAADHPAYVLEAAGRNTLRILSLADVSWYRGNAGAMSLPRWTGDVAAVGFWVLLAMAIAGAFTGRARRLPRALWLAPLLLLLSAVFLGGEMRYRAPIEPFAMLLGAAALTAAWERVRGRPAHLLRRASSMSA